jgi:hypothetical protein
MLVSSILKEAIASTPKNKWPTYDGHYLDRTEFLTSSEVAGCLRMAFFAKHVDRFPHQSYESNGYAERGHAVEAWLVEKFRFIAPLRGVTFQYLGDDQRSFYDADLGLSGTPDGVLTMQDGENILLEFKSFDPRKNTRAFPLKKHVYQCIQNMFLVNKCLGLKGHHFIKRAMILYVNASDLFDQYEFQIDYDEEILRECADRAVSLWEADEPTELEPEGILNGDCEYCKATNHCSACIPEDKALAAARRSAGNFSQTVSKVDELDLTADELDTIAEFIDLKRVGSEVEKMLEEHKKNLHNIFDKVGPVIQLPDGRSLMEDMMAGRASVDKVALEAAGIAIEDYQKVGAPYYQVSFSRNKPNGRDAAEEIRGMIAAMEQAIPVAAEESPQAGEIVGANHEMLAGRNEGGDSTLPPPRRKR